MNKIPILKDGMIGKDGFKQEKNFLPEESEERFIKELQSQPLDWIYRTETITYKYNSNGHRCVEIDELEQDYILFTGCSHTEGVGLKLERTYPYLVAKHYNKSYYNLALGGTGPDVVMINLLGFFNKVKHKPSIVVIQWPDFYRFFNMTTEYLLRLYLPSAPDHIMYKWMINNDIPYRQNVFNRIYILQNLRNLGLTRILENTTEKDEDTIKFQFPETVDKARDISHAGNKTNELWAKSLIKDIDKNFAHVLKM